MSNRQLLEEAKRPKDLRDAAPEEGGSVDPRRPTTGRSRTKLKRARKVKLTLNLSEEVLETVQILAEERDITMTEVVRQALQTEKYLDDARKAGDRLLLTNGKETRELVFRW